MPAGKDYLWGGTRLRKEYRKKIDLIPLAETWECSVHPDGLSIVENGKYRGQTLKDVIDKHPEFLGTKNQEMPVLIKFIDAMKDLSVQVHPYDDYARKYEGDNGKSEMWYVIDAEPGAELIFGFEHPVTKEILKEAVANGTLDKHLHKIKIQKGDVIYVPAGTVHGIGAGALIAEIQESSNVTYRVYDYNRTDKNGNKRELHFDKAVEVMNMDTVKESGEKRLVHYYPGSSREIICRSQYFETEKIEVNKACSFSVMDESFQVLLCISGEGQVGYFNDENKPVRFKKGDCLFIPAGTGRCTLLNEEELNESELRNKFDITGNRIILSVGNLQPRKNLPRLMRAFVKLKKDSHFSDVQLVVVGKKAWMFDDIMKESADNNKDIILTDYVSNEDLVRLYNLADGFVYPSFYEGFGIPPLEAMACGTPVAVANATSLPEVVGDAGMYFDPFSEEEITNSIVKLLDEDKAIRDEKRIERVNCFNWQDSANAMFSKYIEVVGNN